MDRNASSNHGAEYESMSCDEVRYSALRDTKVLQWVCCMRESRGRHLLPFRLLIAIAAGLALTVSLYKMFLTVPGDSTLLLFFCLPFLVMLLFFMAAIEQKTVYDYVLDTDGGGCESYHYFPSWAGAFFNSVAVVAVLTFFVTTVITGSLLPLLGAGALSMGYAGRLLGWKNKINYELSCPWHGHKFVTLDYRRMMIVAHWSDITFGFEMRCQTRKRFDECWNFLSTVLSPDVEILIRDWDAHDAYGLNL